MAVEHSVADLRAHYPELFGTGATSLLDDEDITAVEMAYRQLAGPENRENETRNATITLEHAIRAMLWGGGSDATDTLVLPRHFGGGISADATELASTLRALIPNTHVLILPNNTVSRQARKDQPEVEGQDNLRLSDDEFEEIGRGSVMPLARRLSNILHDQKLDTTNLHFVGASQGAAASQALATHMRDSEQLLVGSLTLVDPPTELDTERAGLNAINLKKSMRHYESNLHIGGVGYALTPDEGMLFKTGKGAPTQEYVHQATQFNNFMVTRAQASTLLPALPGITARGLHSILSSSAHHEHTPKRPFIEFRGEHADHSIAMLPILVAALARRSIYLALNSDASQ